MKIRILLGALILLLSGQASAATFDFNYTSTSTSYTADDGTQTEWMHFDQTDGRSHSYVESQMGAGGIFEDYSFATRADVYDLTYQLFGRAWTTSPASEENLEYYSELGSFFGFDSGPSLDVIWGVTGDTRVILDDITQLLGFQAVSYGPDWGNPDLANTALLTNNVVFDYGIYNDGTNPSITISHIIYRDISPVPIPAAVWLFGTGIIGLIGFSRRRKAA